MNVKHHFLGRGNDLLPLCPVTSSYWDKSEKGAGRSGSFLLCTSAAFRISLLLLPLLMSTSLLLDQKGNSLVEGEAGVSLPLHFTTRARSCDHHDSQTHQKERAAVSGGSSKCQELLNEQLIQAEHRQQILPLQKSSRLGRCLSGLTTGEEKGMGSPPQDLSYACSATFSWRTQHNSVPPSSNICTINAAVTPGTAA